MFPGFLGLIRRSPAGQRMFPMVTLSCDQSVGLKLILQLRMEIGPSLASCELWDRDRVGAFAIIIFRLLLLCARLLQAHELLPQIPSVRVTDMCSLTPALSQRLSTFATLPAPSCGERGGGGIDLGLEFSSPVGHFPNMGKVPGSIPALKKELKENNFLKS